MKTIKILAEYYRAWYIAKHLPPKIRAFELRRAKVAILLAGTIVRVNRRKIHENNR